ncbi:TPA: hypothetical protein ACUM35_001528 [Haemophilus influenzae]|jgi:hypothetical protein|uniref:Uncharacterized protein n=1 Tax=Haemophilus aegyptius TaxID=197575 RepID=A0ABY1VSB5_HAEAE|nr:MULTISPECIES: hypothetical protein [Haemophilus]EGF18041.1 hypothetical protein HMPREF9095_0395 [Haemophilus aegyptius ATCC 11116]MCK8814888.1 hypothetical protein [Haemophilus influenzae]MCK8932275.1 hypothetical protein [Haemophilus influenzae]MCK9666452.1 hypothetical protein [Haemophilus influenzae]MDO7260041.1 hypothetical protein [Haemophilus influenzae]
MALMPYCFDDETESAAEKWCRVNQVKVPEIRSFDDALHSLSKSQFRVEREFDGLQQGFREMLLELADLDFSDLRAGHLTGTKLHHYTEQGQRKIARALRKVRLLSGMFSQGVTEREFTQIDKTMGE